MLFARYVAGAGAVVAPADPEGKVGAAPGLRAWAHEAFELDAAAPRARGGVDAELHVRRIRMRLAGGRGRPTSLPPDRPFRQGDLKFISQIKFHCILAGFVRQINRAGTPPRRNY